MNKKTNISKNFCNHKSQPGVKCTLFYWAITRQQIELQSCSNPLWMGKDL